MALQATLIMLDNSAFALNGDYLPTRWQGQVDAASLLIQAKLQANMQSSVGLALMGGRQVQVLCTMTSDSMKASSFLFGCKVHGELHFTQALQVGALALKHRSNQTQKQRLVCFIGSKIVQDTQTLKALGKKLKKNNISVDVICFGDVSQEQKNKVEAFIKAIEQEQNSRAMIIQPGEVYLSDKLLGSKIFNGGQGGSGNAPGGVGGIEQDDPELAEAIRQSLLQSQQQAPQVPQVPVIQQQQAEKKQQSNNIVDQQDQQQLERLAIQMSLRQMEEEKNKQNDKKQDKN